MVRDSVKFLVDTMLKTDVELENEKRQNDNDVDVYVVDSRENVIQLEQEFSAIKEKNCFMC
jgi:hypothetical protein